MTGRRTAIVGGGPAGLYLAIELARTRPGDEVTVFDHGSAPGVGVVLDAEFVETLAGRDPVSARRIGDAARAWDTVRMHLPGGELVTGGHRILGVSRHALVGALRERAAGLGVRLRTAPPAQPGPADGYDLLVGADGAGSAVRSARSGAYGASVSPGRAEYLWMRTGTPVEPGFWLAPVGDGAVVAHAYPYGAADGAVVAECLPDVARAAGLSGAPRAAVEDRLTALFADQLGAGRLAAATFPWRPFRTVRNRRWYAGNHVLIGDAAHTTHYSVGSGTRLAIEDAIALAEALGAAADLGGALAAYEAARRPAVAAVQIDARSSQLWFEGVGRHLRLTPDRFAFALRCRREVNTYGWLAGRDPAFVGRVLADLRADPRCPPGGSAARPCLLPLRLGRITLPHRLVRAAGTALPAGVPPGLTLAGRLPAPVAGRPWGGVISVSPQGAVEVREPAAGQWPASLTAAPDRATGVFLRPAECTAAVLRAAGRADFVVVPAGTGYRVERTHWAEVLRNEYGGTVLVWADRVGADEADTSIAAGRVDGYLLDAGAPDRHTEGKG